MNGMQGQIPPQALMAAMMARLGQQGGGPPGMPPGPPPGGPMGGPPGGMPPGMPPGGMPPMGPPPQMQPGVAPPMTPPMPGQGNRAVAALMDLGNHMKFVLSQLDDGDEAKDRITSMAQELDNVIAMKTQPASMGRPMPDQMPDQPVDEMGNLGGAMNSQGNPPPEGAPGPGR